MSSQNTLSAASNDRKARLAQLRSLKNKEASGPQDSVASKDVVTGSKRKSRSPSPPASTTILSGRNYDFESRGPKLGFESNPIDGQDTIEIQAMKIAADTKKLQQEEEKTDKALDLFNLQPKKPNWDLKRDMNKKLEILDVRTDNSIARLVRDRIQKARNDSKGNGDVLNGEAAGLDGNVLLEATHLREREEEEEERRERQIEAEDGFT